MIVVVTILSRLIGEGRSKQDAWRWESIVKREVEQLYIEYF